MFYLIKIPDKINPNEICKFNIYILYLFAFSLVKYTINKKNTALSLGISLFTKIYVENATKYKDFHPTKKFIIYLQNIR